MATCIACPDREEHDSDYESRWLVCRRAHDRMLAALREIPVLVDELAGLGYVERDTREGVQRLPVLRDDGSLLGFMRVPGPADPVAHALTAGPTNGQSSQPRVGGSALPSVPIRIDPTDLLAPARPASLAVADVGLYATDQVGHLAVATELEFWARDWADQRGERSPYPTVRVLASWLLDRLDWACKHHLALDEFAAKVTQLRSTLTAATGRLDLRPTPVDRPCPACGVLALQRPPDGRFIECGSCGRALTDDEYRDHLEDVIKTNWTRPVDGLPPLQRLVWARDAAKGVTPALYSPPHGWMEYFGDVLEDVSYWAEIHYPADPGPAKDDAS